MLTKEQFVKIIPSLSSARLDSYTSAINTAMAEVAINTPQRIAMFIAQCAPETGNYSAFVENLNYSAEALLAVFPTHFNAAQAALYARKPQSIADHAYANRNGNGNELSGDGWKYRGRGVIQTTFKDGYARAQEAFGVALVDNPDLLLGDDMVFRSGGLYWNDHKLNAFADALDVRGCRHAINGGYNGLGTAETVFARARSVLGF